MDFTKLCSLLTLTATIAFADGEITNTNSIGAGSFHDEITKGGEVTTEISGTTELVTDLYIHGQDLNWSLDRRDFTVNGSGSHQIRLDSGNFVVDTSWSGSNAVINVPIDMRYFSDFIKNGDNSVTLGAQNTYVGNTKINGGELIIGSGGSVETDRIQINSGATFEVKGDGALTANPGIYMDDFSSFILDGSVVVSDLMTLHSGKGVKISMYEASLETQYRRYTDIFNGAIIGSGKLIIGEGADFILGGANAYTGGTEVNSATLEAKFDAIPGDVSGNGEGTLEFSFNEDEGTIISNYSGLSEFILSGENSIIEVGENGYVNVPKTSVSAGTLNVNQGGLNTTNIHLSGGTLQLGADSDVTVYEGVTMEGDSHLDVSGHLFLPMLQDGTQSAANSIVTIQPSSSFFLNVPLDATSTFSGQIQGDGALNLTGPGRVVLNGNNTFNGLNIEGPTLSVKEAAALGSGDINHKGGKLEITATMTDSHNHHIEKASLIEVDSGQIYTVTGDITGTFPLAKTGAGTMVMMTPNQYKIDLPGEILTVTEGRLKTNPAVFTDTTPTLSLFVLDHSAIEFNVDSGSQNWVGDVKGIGDFYKTGAGTVVFTGLNEITLPGAVYVQEGTLELGSDATLGEITVVDIAANAHFVANNSTTITNLSGYGGIAGSHLSELTLHNLMYSYYSGSMGGAGNWRTSGVAALNLTGDHTATGGFTHAEGDLYNNGDMRSFSGVTVLYGASLGGNGYNPDTLIRSGGTHGSGNSIGSSTFTQLTFEDGATHEVEYSSSTIDHTIVTGNLNLEPGAILDIIAMPGTKTKLNERQTFLTVNEALTGEFTTVNIDNSNDLMQRSIDVIYTPATTLTGASTIELLFGLRSPQSFDTRMLSLASDISKQIDDYQMSNIRDQILSGVVDEECPVPISYKPFAVYNHRDGGFRGEENSTPSHFTLDGVTTGLQADVYKHLGVGLAYGYTNSTIKADHNWGQLDTDSHSVIGFINMGCLNNFNLDGEYISTWTRFESNRLDTDGSYSTAKYNGWEQSANLRGIYDYQFKSVHILPILGMRYVYFNIDGYTESGSEDESINVKKDHANQLYTDLGVTLTRPIAIKKYKLTPQLGLMWSHQYLNDGRNLSVALNEDHRESALMPLPRSERNAGIVNLGLDFSDNEGMSTYLNLDTIFSSNSRFTWDARVGIQATF